MTSQIMTLMFLTLPGNQLCKDRSYRFGLFFSNNGHYAFVNTFCSNFEMNQGNAISNRNSIKCSFYIVKEIQQFTKISSLPHEPSFPIELSMSIFLNCFPRFKVSKLGYSVNSYLANLECCDLATLISCDLLTLYRVHTL